VANVGNDLPPISELSLEEIREIENPWDDHVGWVPERFEPGVILEGHVEIDKRHQQPYGIVHGGVWCSIVEGAASMAAGLTAEGNVVGVSNSTDFIRSHREGRIDIVAEPLIVGRRQHLWEVRLTRASDGKLVARGQVRFQVLDEVR
jgi:uncharacterized protein (TIGR00369 family)